MFTRRKFLHNSLLGGLVASQSNFWATAAIPGSELAENQALPIVLTTWKNPDANLAALEVLGKNGRALDAVEAGVRVPEADPNDTSVGYGGLPDRDGHVTLDACIMDEFGMAGSVCFLEGIKHPISVARKVLEKTPHVMLVGEGALQFALEEGFTKEDLLTDKSRKAWEEWKIKSEYKPKINIERHDTCGMLAIASDRRMAGACTTSGLAFKMRGRVGDSPIIGAGLFVDDEVGGAVCTGLGEIMLRTLASFLVVEEMRRGKTPQRAAETAIRRIAQKYPKAAAENQVGILAINKAGAIGAYSMMPGFVYTISKAGKTQVLDSKSFFKKAPNSQ